MWPESENAKVVQSFGLATDSLDAIAALEQRTVAADGGRLKLEWGTLRARPFDQVNDLLWWDGPQLLGFLGMYCFDGHNVELVGMVDPAARRLGIANALLDAALLICRERTYTNVLLVTPRSSVAGQCLAASRGAVLDHSEYALVLTSPPTEASGSKRPELDITLRTATVDDSPAVDRLTAAAFGYAPHDTAERIRADPGATILVEVHGQTIGTLRVNRADRVGGVYGFAIDPPFQGRGIGREVLRRVCSDLFAEGVERIGLEVATENDHALGLYTSIGFTPVTTEDYFSIGIVTSD